MKIHALSITLCFFSALTLLAEPLKVPQMEGGNPSAGKRVKIIPPEYEGTDVYYSLYLPENYQRGKQYPLIVEYTGNYWPPSGSTGEVKDANLGYAAARHMNAIWVVLPYVKGNESILNWWGSEEETIAYALKNIRRVCIKYGADPAEIILCGFSRGAIAVNYIGLYNDEIADVWLGFFTHDHYDGQKTWGKPWAQNLDTYRLQACERMKRMNKRAAFVSNNSIGPSEVSTYLKENQLDTLGKLQFNDFNIHKVIKNIPNKNVVHEHTDKWMLYQSEYTTQALYWFESTIQNKPGTFSVSGRVIDKKGRPRAGITVESGATHFAFTNKKGEYVMDGLSGGKREIIVGQYAKDINLTTDMSQVNFEIIKEK